MRSNSFARNTVSKLIKICRGVVAFIIFTGILLLCSGIVLADNGKAGTGIFLIAQNEVKSDDSKKTEDSKKADEAKKTDESKKAVELKKPPTTVGKLPLPAVKDILFTEKPLPGALTSQPPEDKTTAQSATGDSAGVSVKAGTAAAAPGAVTASKQKKEEKAKKPSKLMEELSIFNVPTNNMRTMKVVIDDQYFLRGIVYGDERGLIHIYQADDNDNFSEVWKSQPLNSPIRGIFVADLYGKGETIIVAYTQNGNIFLYGYDSHNLIYRSPEGTYQQINCMVVENVDSDPQKELLFIATKKSASTANLIQFDAQTLFEEWTSSEAYSATDMLVGNVDTDPDKEIVMNTGEVLSMRFKSLKWKCDISDSFGDRLQLIDMDNDGILEVVAEYNQTYVRVIDVDQRLEKW